MMGKIRQNRGERLNKLHENVFQIRTNVEKCAFTKEETFG